MRSRPCPRHDLSGRRVLITGGSSGIGIACGRELARRGATVGLVARGEAALGEAATALGPSAVTADADVRDLEGLRAAFATVAGALGGLDAVIANAGAGAYGPFVEMSPEDYELTVETTLLGTMHTAHLAIPYLRQTRGTLVIVGSVAGRIATPWLSTYAAAKHGVRGFARSLSVELRALDIPVNVALVAPGPVDTPFWRRARSTDERLPPKLAGVYRPADVAAEVARALHDPRTERTVGGLMAAWAFVDAVAPNVALRAMGPLARLGWRKRERHPPAPEDALTDRAKAAEISGGMPSRPSALRKLRDWAGIGR